MVRFTREFIESRDREEIEAARTTAPSAKMALGGKLLDALIERMRDGVRDPFPAADSAQIESQLRQRLDAGAGEESGD